MDRRAFDSLQDKYGPDMKQSEVFERKYMEFCAINGLDPLCSFHLALGQAVTEGAALSSLNTNFGTLMKRHASARDDEGRRKNYIMKKTLKAAAADADAVQTRIGVIPIPLLSKAVDTIAEPSIQAVCWMCFVTGNRAANIWMLRSSQITLSETDICIEWRLRKGTGAERSKRTKLKYFFNWTMSPPRPVKEYLAGFSGAELPFKITRIQKMCATSVTKAMRGLKIEGLEGVTSYVFRDTLDDHLRVLGLPVAEREALLDHGETVALAHYGNPQEKKPKGVTRTTSARKGNKRS